MAAGGFFNCNMEVFPKNSTYLERPRVQRLLEDAMSYPLVAVYAGSGYGKTRAVYSFLQNFRAYTTWIQLTDRDNIPARFWESFVHMISISWPHSAPRLLEVGFPETDDAFGKFADLMREAPSFPGKHIMVYDDFHLLKNGSVLKFLDKALKMLPPNATVVLISRTMPEVSIVSLMLREQIFTIREDALCFTEDEIAEFFNQQALPVTRQNIRDIYDDTRGWAFAINLIGRSFLKDSKYERYALEAMKENVYKLIETELSQMVSPKLRNLLLRVSLIDHFAANLIKSLADSDELINELEQLNAYVRYDFHIGAYMMHNLFMDYLRQHHDELAEAEICDTYKKAGEWSENNGYIIDALSYYEKAYDYDSIMRMIYVLNLQISPDTARFALEIFNRIPKDAVCDNILFPSMHIKILICLGLPEQASAMALQYIAEYELRPDSPEKYQTIAGIYGALAIMRMIMSPYTHTYDFDTYFKKFSEYYDKYPYESYGPVTNQPVGAYALLVGTNRSGAPEEYIDALSRAIPYSAHALNGNLYGLDDLARGEMYFYRRNINSAEQYFNVALGKARAKGQFDIINRSIQYLMLIAFSRGEVGVADGLLQQIADMLDIKEYSTRYEAFDIARSHYYLVLGQPEQIPDWLKSDFVGYAHPAFLESYANRIRAQYRYVTRQYSTLLAFLETSQSDCSLLIASIMYKVIEALTLYQLKRRSEAISVLEEAYALAAPNGFITPFTQYSKDMRTLTGAALREGSCSIPRPWLEDINRKASAFARRLTHMVAENRAAGEGDCGFVLTNRETKIMKDLSQGLSRTEIAASQNISVNTVKMVINSIYDKLCVTSMHDAIRIALARGIV
ncbi:MAG: LuxR C-terminal-related transcriptional regulator [Oscillospiraceae bacterium]|nr:LuxR C-terminal-related transcriptional regulator [Oscillospiraceae bacterium]